MRLRDYAARYIQFVDGSDGYHKQLLCAVSALENFAGRVLDMEDVTAELVNEYLYSTKDRLSGVTRRARRNMIRRLLGHFHDGALPPMRWASVKTYPRAPQAWTVAQVRDLLDVATRLEGRYRVSKGGYILDRVGPPKSEYWRAWILSAWDCGLRGCDLRRLQMAQIGDRGNILVRQVKTGKPIVCRVRQRAKVALDTLGGDVPLKNWCAMCVWRRIAQRLVTDAGLPGSIGWLRHSAGTATDIAHPGKGYQFLGNTPAVFYANYFDRSHIEDLPQPPEL